MNGYNYLKRKLPDYYPEMYLDGFTPEEIMTASHEAIRKRFLESR